MNKVNTPCSDFEEGRNVLTAEKLGPTTGMACHGRYLENRKPSSKGMMRAPLPGHGGEAVIVTHEDGTDAAYALPDLIAL